MLWKFDCSNNLHMWPRTKDVGSRMYFSWNVIKMEKHWPNDQLLSNFLISMPFLKIDLSISSCRWRAATASLFALRLYGQNHDPLGSWGGFWSVDREGQCCACRSTEPTHIYNKWIQSFLIVSTGFVHTSTETRTPTSSVYFGQFSFQLLVTWSGAWTPPPPPPHPAPSAHSIPSPAVSALASVSTLPDIEVSGIEVIDSDEEALSPALWV